MNFNDNWSPARAAVILAVTAIAGGVITWAAYDSATQVAGNAAQARFKFERAETIAAIETRMYSYETVLRSTKSVFGVKPDMSRENWHDYLRGLRLEQNFPGTQGIGYSIWLTPSEVPEYEARIRTEGFPEFAVSPAGPRDEYTSITFIEPMDARNRKAFGYDMWSQETRRQAMSLARDEGRVAMSGPVKLVQEIDADVQAGVLIYLPYYNQPLSRLQTIAQRRKALNGFVYGAFRMGDLMSGILGRDTGVIDVALYDTNAADTPTLLYRSANNDNPQTDKQTLTATDTINIYGRSWRLESQSKPLMFARTGATGLPSTTLIGGLTTTTFILLLLALTLNTRRRAHVIATEITQDLDLRTEELSKALIRQEAVEDELRLLVTIDALTGLHNRTAFNDWLRDITDGNSFDDRGGIRLSEDNDNADSDADGHGVLMMDIDRFKVINDTLGHRAGDELLRAIGTRLKNSLHADIKLARIGGDEFALVIADSEDLATSRALAAAIMDLLVEPIDCGERTLKATCSIGIAFLHGSHKDPQRAIAHADLALYRAKSVGRNVMHVFDAQLEADVVRRAAIEDALDGALERGEFHLEYQPKLDANGGKVVGAETLLRWNNPKIGFIPPDLFIPIAEETGHIAPLSRWILDTACAQSRKWQDEGLIDFPLAINLSAQQIQSSDLVKTVSDTLKKHQIEPSMIELEITESMLIDDFEKTAGQLRELRELGVRIAIDDFGTGYSSLSYLHRLEVDILKIDRSFVGSIETSQSRSIVTSIIGLARTLRLHTVAEGVETVEQARFLRANGCDEMQGWLFSRSLKADDFEIWVRKGTDVPLRAQIVTA